MIQVISFDMDGTLVNSRFVDRVWMEGMPGLYAERHGLEFSEAKELVLREYLDVGSGRLEWYDMQYWLDRFDLREDKYSLIGRYAEEIEVFPEVEEVLKDLSDQFRLVVTSNAASEFIEIELEGLAHHFTEIFSVTSEFKRVKKSSEVYREVCRRMGAKPLEVFHVGDHYEYDYQSPLEAGLDALFLDRTGKLQGREVVCDLREAAEHILNYA
ncbi:MAG: HAD family hydrolase [Methanotrichaceae archaeon]|nr:HAD family hydrolase [Methanotrichaceae archaeon]